MVSCKVALLLLMAGAALAIPAEHRESSSAESSPSKSKSRTGASPQNRDGGSSSYAAPAPSHEAPAPSYEAPAPSYEAPESGDQGNLYYYYYPVEEYGETEIKDGDDVGILLSIIIPLLVVGGVLLCLSSLSFAVSTGRAHRAGENDVEGDKSSMMDALQNEVERVFYIYLNALESEQCMQRSLCEFGVYTRNFRARNTILSMVEPMVPDTMKGNLDIFKKAAISGQETGKCSKYKCTPPKVF